MARLITAGAQPHIVNQRVAIKFVDTFEVADLLGLG